MKNLTNSQLISKARDYDRIQNEGGEGYNPYSQELERREMAAEATRPKSRAERRDSILRDLERKDCSIARECGTYNPAEIDRLRAELAEIDAADEADFAAEWTLSTTTTRRAEWNAFISALIGKDGRIAPKDGVKINRRISEQGWGVDELRKAIALHNLGPAK